MVVQLKCWSTDVMSMTIPLSRSDSSSFFERHRLNLHNVQSWRNYGPSPSTLVFMNNQQLVIAMDFNSRTSEARHEAQYLGSCLIRRLPHQLYLNSPSIRQRLLISHEPWVEDALVLESVRAKTCIRVPCYLCGLGLPG